MKQLHLPGRCSTYFGQAAIIACWRCCPVFCGVVDAASGATRITSRRSRFFRMDRYLPILIVFRRSNLLKSNTGTR